MSNQIVIKISDKCAVFRCTFQDSVSIQVFERFLELNEMPGWMADYGANNDKVTSFNIWYDKTKKAKDVIKSFQASLRDVFGICKIVWKRDIDYDTREGSRVLDVFN